MSPPAFDSMYMIRERDASAMVLKLAAGGRQHPDAEVAAAAYRWAERQPQSRIARTFDVVVETVSGVLAPGSADLGEVRERLAAHHIVKLGPPAGSDG